MNAKGRKNREARLCLDFLAQHKENNVGAMKMITREESESYFLRCASVAPSTRRLAAGPDDDELILVKCHFFDFYKPKSELIKGFGFTEADFAFVDGIPGKQRQLRDGKQKSDHRVTQSTNKKGPTTIELINSYVRKCSESLQSLQNVTTTNKLLGVCVD